MATIHPLSYSQELMLAFAAETGFSAARWNQQVIFDLADLDEVAVREAVQALVFRHGALRTRIGESSGRHCQVVDDPGGPVALIVADQTAPEAASAPFDLAAGPLLRAALRPQGDGAELVLTFSHLVGDHLSAAQVAAEFTALYDPDGRRAALAPSEQSFAAYARSQRGEAARYLREPSSSPQWAGYDAAARALAPPPGPAAHSRVQSPVHSRVQNAAQSAVAPVPPAQAAQGPQEWDVTVPEAVIDAARVRRCTVATMVMAAVVAAAGRAPGLGIDLVVSDRALRQPVEFAATVGPFADIWPVARPERPGGPDHDEVVLAQVRERLLDALDATMPFLLLVRRQPWLAAQLRRPGGPPWMFVQFASEPVSTIGSGRVRSVSLPSPIGPEHRSFGLHLRMVQRGRSVSGRLRVRAGVAHADVDAFAADVARTLLRLADPG
jgi:Condensation domain